MICKDALDVNRIARALTEIKKSKKSWQTRKIYLTNFQATSCEESDLNEVFAENLIVNPAHELFHDGMSKNNPSEEMDATFTSVSHNIIGTSHSSQVKEESKNQARNDTQNNGNFFSCTGELAQLSGLPIIPMHTS